MHSLLSHVLSNLANQGLFDTTWQATETTTPGRVQDNPVYCCGDADRRGQYFLPHVVGGGCHCQSTTDWGRIILVTLRDVDNAYCLTLLGELRGNRITGQSFISLAQDRVVMDAPVLLCPGRCYVWSSCASLPFTLYMFQFLHLALFHCCRICDADERGRCWSSHVLG